MNLIRVHLERLIQTLEDNQKQIVKHVHLDSIVLGLIQGCQVMDFQMKQDSVWQVIIVMVEQLLLTKILLLKELIL
jgi:hypothetical protein